MEQNSSSLCGTLYLVSTPIGNMKDISLRAIETLKAVDAILAEDTRHSGQLCKHLGIEKPFISMHAHNEHLRSDSILAKLKQGTSFALISDAGTPLIADPGFPLVRKAREADIPVVPVPGCSAFVTALSASGLPCDKFRFEGFLPAQASFRKKRLEQLGMSEETTVIYESTHRIVDAITDIVAIFGGDYRFLLAKELTKTFETFIYKEAKAILAWLKAEPMRQKGEFVLIFPPNPPKENSSEHVRILSLLLKELPLKQAVSLATEITHASKNVLYKMALVLQNEVHGRHPDNQK